MSVAALMEVLRKTKKWGCRYGFLDVIPCLCCGYIYIYKSGTLQIVFIVLEICV
jgi:hypothetical protein